MTFRVTLTQTKTEFTPTDVGFFDPTDDFKTFFQSWIDSGKMTEIQNQISADGTQKISIVEFQSEVIHNEFIAQPQNADYVTYRNAYNVENNISFNRIVEVV